MHVIKYFDNGYRYGLLVKEGHIWNHVIIIDYPIRVIRIKSDDDRFTYEDYPVKKAVRHFQSFGRTHGITEAAKKLLKGAA